MPTAPRLDLVHKAITAGMYGNIEFKESAYRQLRDDSEMQGFTPQGIRALLRDHVRAGNVLDIRSETRTEKLAEDPDDPYWYRAVLPVPAFPKGLFLEIKLIDADEVEPFVQIVSVHQQR